MNTDGKQKLLAYFSKGEEALAVYTPKKIFETIEGTTSIKVALNKSSVTVRDITLAFDYDFGLAFISNMISDYASFINCRPSSEQVISIAQVLYMKASGLYLSEWGLFFMRLKTNVYGEISKIEGNAFVKAISLYFVERQRVISEMHSLRDEAYKKNAIPMPDNVKQALTKIFEGKIVSNNVR